VCVRVCLPVCVCVCVCVCVQLLETALFATETAVSKESARHCCIMASERCLQSKVFFVFFVFVSKESARHCCIMESERCLQSKVAFSIVLQIQLGNRAG
jgi:hypothetical protein